MKVELIGVEVISGLVSRPLSIKALFIAFI